MTKRITALVLTLALTMTSAISPVTVFASGGDVDPGGIEVIKNGVQTAINPDMDPYPDEDFEAVAVLAQYQADLPARSAILMDQVTGKVMFELNPDEPMPPASVTKIMTLLLVMEALESGKINIDDKVVTSEYANSMGGSQIWLKVGEEMSVDNLLKAVAIASANDASVALGEHVAGSNDVFISMMNDRAKALGMDNTHFKNATGLDEEGHLTTARDIALMSRELIRHPKISEYSTIWMDSLRGGETELVNTNKLVRFYKGATGLKTGTTDGAGSCLSATANRDGLSLVSVVMGCPTSNDRFASARGLLDFGFANYQSSPPPPVDDMLTPVKVLRGVEDSVMPVYSEPGKFIIERGQESLITQEVTLTPDVEAPVEAGQVIGKVEVLVNGELVGQYDLTAGASVARMTYTKAFGKLMNAMLRMKRGVKADKIVTDTEGTANTDSNKSVKDTESTEASKPCTCEEGKCYCKDIGDICGCTKK